MTDFEQQVLDKLDLIGNRLTSLETATDINCPNHERRVRDLEDKADLQQRGVVAGLVALVMTLIGTIVALVKAWR